jgi:hypothetical protein
MARYKKVNLSPRFLAVDLEKQLLPVSFAHAVHYLLENDFALSGFEVLYRNNATGASAYPPKMLLKVILCAYAEGIVSSQGIERLCREHVRYLFCFQSIGTTLAEIGNATSRTSWRQDATTENATIALPPA